MVGLTLAHSVLAVIHILAGAAWFGSMFYSFFVLHPRAQAYFKRNADFESFIAEVSHGARWKVLSALGLIALTGVALVLLRWPQPMSMRWLLLIGAKVAVFTVALVLFIYTSWRLWPARLVASFEEVPKFQKVFRQVAAAMISFAALSMALGVFAHIWR